MLELSHWIIDYFHPQGYRIDRPQGINAYLFLLFKQPVSILQDGVMTEAAENSCILYEKWTPQLYYSDRGGYRHDGLFFDGEETPVFLQSLGLPLNRVFPLQNAKAITDAIQDIASESFLRETYSAEIIDLRLRALFYKLADIYHHSESYAHSYYTKFQQVRRDIYRHPEQNWRAETLSGELHLSLSRFQHLYKSFFDTALGQDVIQSRVENARYLLKSTAKTVAAIAGECGYNNEEHFIRQFKKLSGLSPGEYRRQHVRPLSSGEKDSKGKASQTDRADRINQKP